MVRRDRLVEGSRLAVRALMVANRLFLGALLAGFILSWFFPQFPTWLDQSLSQTEVASARIGMRLLMLIGISGAVATDRFFVSLAQIIASVREGDPFIVANARRLQTIGWWLLVLQLLDIPCALLGKFFPILGSAAPSDSFSIGGWISVLMVFILSRVFAAGSAMRDELEGTV